MAILNGTFTRRIFSSFATEYHVLLFLDDDRGLVSVILNTNKLPPLDKRMRVRGRYKESIDYGERFICREYQEEQEYQITLSRHNGGVGSLLAMLET